MRQKRKFPENIFYILSNRALTRRSITSCNFYPQEIRAAAKTLRDHAMLLFKVSQRQSSNSDPPRRNSSVDTRENLQSLYQRRRENDGR